MCPCTAMSNWCCGWKDGRHVCCQKVCGVARATSRPSRQARDESQCAGLVNPFFPGRILLGDCDNDVFDYFPADATPNWLRTSVLTCQGVCGQVLILNLPFSCDDFAIRRDLSFLRPAQFILPFTQHKGLMLLVPGEAQGRRLTVSQCRGCIVAAARSSISEGAFRYRWQRGCSPVTPVAPLRTGIAQSSTAVAVDTFGYAAHVPQVRSCRLLYSNRTAMKQDQHARMHLKASL